MLSATVALSVTLEMATAPISSAASSGSPQPAGFRDAICYWWPALCG